MGYCAVTIHKHRLNDGWYSGYQKRGTNLFVYKKTPNIASLLFSFLECFVRI